ncbi:MAG: OB-fold domain-containing protein [Gammaproteobacteria bacterium]|nr:OB-fold domain-containing protein [Gammaproteobacteria bacterium]
MSDYKKPLPQVEPYTQAFWDGTKNGKLLVQTCSDCNARIFFPRKQCPECWSTNLGWMEASGKATVYSYSVTYEGVEAVFKDDLPIVLAWVDLPEGIRMQTNIVECDSDSVHIGQDVEVVFKAVTDDITLPYFRPVA